MSSPRDDAFDRLAAACGCRFDGDLQVGGDYVPIVVDNGLAWISGQIPRIGNMVAVTGTAGADVSLEEAQRAATICVLRALALLQRAQGSLDRVRRVLRLSVFVQSAAGFVRQSEVADAASAALHEVLGEAGRHARTSVGVFQLPKNATVELDLVAALD